MLKFIAILGVVCLLFVAQAQEASVDAEPEIDEDLVAWKKSIDMAKDLCENNTRIKEIAVQNFSVTCQ